MWLRSFERQTQMWTIAWTNERTKPIQNMKRTEQLKTISRVYLFVEAFATMIDRGSLKSISHILVHA